MYKKSIGYIIASCSIMASVSLPAVSHEIGLQLYSLRNEMKVSVPGAFKKINKWGIKVVEGGGALYDLSLADYKAELDRYNLDIVSVDTSYDEIVTNPMAVVYKAKHYGSRFATFYWIPHDGKTGFTLDNAKEAVVALNKAGKLLKQNGITLQYHPHGYEFSAFEGGTILDYMVKHVEHAQFQMDVFWFNQAGANPVQWLKKYPGRFTSLHLKDRLKGSPDSLDGKADVETNVVLGTGDVGIEAVVAEAKRQGIRYYFIEDESSRVLKQVPLSFDYLKSLDKK